MRFPGRSLLFSTFLAALIVPIVWAFDDSLGRDELWAEFRHPVFFGDRLLPEGRYLFVHDDYKNAIMEPCLSVYAEKELEEPLLAIHCVRRAQRPTERGKIVWGTVRGDNVREFGYIQFAGDWFAHYAH